MILALATGALALSAAPLAQASTSDRGRYHMPNRWERAHGLNPARRGNRDPDHDGPTNVAEYRSGTDPRKADSDRDGIRDGCEDAHRDGLRRVPPGSTGAARTPTTTA